MKRALSMVVCDRPHYLRQVLDSLEVLMKDFKGWEMFFNCEPICAESIRLVQEFAKVHGGVVIINKPRAGQILNFYKAFKRPFSLGFDYVVIAEDDAVMASDLLRWHDFASEKFKDDKSVFTVAGGHYFQKGKIDQAMLPFYGFQSRSLLNQCWGTWRDRWFEDGGMDVSWERSDTVVDDKVASQNFTHGGYDGYIEQVHFKGRRQAYPIVTRVNNIGEVGVGCTSEVFNRLVKIDDWAGNYDLSSIRDYHEQK